MSRTIRTLAAGMLILFTARTAAAAAISWDGGGSSDNWSDFINFSDDSDPSGDSVTFNNTDAVGTAGTVNNIVDGNVSINSLTYANNGSNFHTTQINSGVTLTVNGTGTSLLVGDQAANTTVNITGAGKLNVNNAAATIRVDTTNSANLAKLDMSGLTDFAANVANFRVAVNGPGPNYSQASVLLANTNVITAATEFLVAGTLATTDAVDIGTVRLGTSNAINTALIAVGRGKGNGTLNFQTGLTNPTVTILGATGGSSRADLDIGAMKVAANGAPAVGVVDLSAGTTTAMLGAVLIGQGANAGTGQSGTGTLSFSAGTIDATSIVLGRGVGGNGFGTLTQTGGTLIAGTITMGDQTATATGSTATVNLTSGTIKATSITNGLLAATRTFNWNSGTLQNKSGTNLTITAGIPLKLLTAATHTFTADPSRTIDANSVISGLSGTGGITKSGTGLLNLNAANTYTGSTIVSAGTLALGAAGSIASSSLVEINAGSIFDTTSQSFTMLGAQPLTFVLDPTGSGSAGLLSAAALNISAGVANFTTLGTLNDAAYVIASYTSLTGGSFASATAPGGYTINYNYNGLNQIALVQVSVPELATMQLLLAGVLFFVPWSKRVR
jgi:autotransporter-associated beta strand protein